MKKYKRYIYLFLAAILTLSVFCVQAEEGILENQPIRVWLNGSYITFDQSPITESDRTLVPARKIFELFGMQVAWDDANNLVTADKEDLSILLTIDQKNSVVNGKEIELEVPARVINGRTMVPLRFIAESTGAKVEWDESAKTIYINYDPKIGDVVSFHVGSDTLTQTVGQPIQFELIGGISVPETENNPVVVLLHGRHDVTDVNSYRYDLGFSYLMKELSQKGYLALALNINVSYSFDYGEPVGYERLIGMVNSHLNKLEQANEGNNIGYGIDLKGKADMSHISLIGHSMGGQGIFYVAKDQKEKGRNIDALVSIAPSLSVEMESSDFIDVPTAVVIPQYDDDVISLDGQTVFDMLNEKKDVYAHLVYLFGANHNSVNEAAYWSGLGHIPPESKNYPDITAQRQREFYSQYIPDFLNLATKGEAKENGFRSTDKAPGKMYGFDVLTSLKEPGSERIIDPTVKIDAAKLDVEKIYLSDNSTETFNPPGNRNYDLLSISWEKKGGNIYFPIKQKLKKSDSIDFKVAQDSSSALNNEKNQAITVVLRQDNGKEQSIVYDQNTPALFYQDGKLIEDDIFGLKVSYWSSFTPLSSMRVRLADFNNLDAERIIEIELRFNQTDSGRLMIRSADLMYGK